MNTVQTLPGQSHGTHDARPDFGEVVPPLDPSCFGAPSATKGSVAVTSRLGRDISPGPDIAADRDTAHWLLDSLAQGNSPAFWELWALYKAHLYKICLSQMFGVREDAEDALSRAMLRALDKLPHIGPQIENVRAWLSRLTVNLCADMHRERKRRERQLEQIDDVLPNCRDSRPADADSPEDAFLSREAYDCMCDAVNDLPDRLREPFALRFFQEMAYVDIAERLTLSNENVRKRIQQARDILKQRLNVTAVADGVPIWQGQTLSAGSRAPRQQELPRRVSSRAVSVHKTHPTSVFP
jgi:RNA polymerase sigma factor (sigma-70 family)